MARSSLTLALALFLSACGGGGGGGTPPPPPPPTVLTASLNVDQVLAGGAAVPLTASASNGSTVSWQLAAGAPGALSAGSGNSISYTPPAGGISAITDVLITASAGGASKQLAITVFPDPGQPGLSLLAGSAGRSGFGDGPGSTAAFSGIQSIAPDNEGGYYIYDGTPTQLTIRRLSASGNVSTIYSNAALYNTDTQHYRSRLAAASDGALYALTAQGADQRVLRIGSNGSTAVVLSGAAANTVTHLLKARDGAIYLITNKALLKMSASGVATIVAGDPDAGPPSQPMPQADGEGRAARFSIVSAAGADADGNLLLVDENNFRRVSASGVVTTVAIPALAGKTVASIAGGPDGAFYVLASAFETRGSALQEVYNIFRVAPSNETAAMINAADPAILARSPSRPFAVAGNGNRILLALNNEILQVDAGKSRSLAGAQESSGLVVDGGPGEARFALPNAIAADRQGNVYVLDHPGAVYQDCLLCFAGTRGATLRKVTPSGHVSTLGSSADTGNPSGTAMDRAGNFYFSDIHPYGSHGSSVGSAIYKISTDGKFSVLAGCPPSRNCGTGSADGPGADARFTAARLAGIDADGNLYAEDSGRFRKIAPDGTTSTIPALPAGIGAALDGSRYTTRVENPDKPNGSLSTMSIIRTAANGAETVAASGVRGPVLVAPAGPYTVAVISRETIMKLVVPH